MSILESLKQSSKPSLGCHQLNLQGFARTLAPLVILVFCFLIMSIVKVALKNSLYLKSMDVSEILNAHYVDNGGFCSCDICDKGRCEVLYQR